jgi:hypothetical protein
VAVGPGPFTGTAGRPGGLGAILGVRTAGEGGEAAPADAAGDNADPDKITFADA